MMILVGKNRGLPGEKTAANWLLEAHLFQAQTGVARA